MSNFSSVYGPVKSWRYGRSLGIDPIGAISSCSFSCAYCQLGKIQYQTLERHEFITTEAIASDLRKSDYQSADVVTVSGSGEPTLALNLGDIAIAVKEFINKPLIVLTNGTLLGNSSVRSALQLVDEVSVKLDGVSTEQIKRVNKPSFPFDWQEFWLGILNFRQSYSGLLTVQTMFLNPWDIEEKKTYINLMATLQPDRIYLNVPSRPKPMERSLDGRENHAKSDNSDRISYQFPCLNRNWLAEFAQEIRANKRISIDIGGA
jgi:wyosine [tRNA(Phe)-imidazoG37] synthetase (radical SAM superfamily)